MPDPGAWEDQAWTWTIAARFMDRAMNWTDRDKDKRKEKADKATTDGID